MKNIIFFKLFKKKQFEAVCSAVFFVLNAAAVHTQGTAGIDVLRKEFARTDLNGKTALLKKASASKRKANINLYKDALSYVEASYSILNNEPALLEIGITSVTELGFLREKTSVQTIRYLFSVVENEDFQIACLKSLTVLLEADSGFTSYINSLYENGFQALLSGKNININLLIAYADALKAFSDSSSFKILFKTLLYPVDERLKEAVKNALNGIPFDYYKEIVGKTWQTDIQYVYLLYLSVKENKKIEKKDLGRISEAVIRYGLENLDTHPEKADSLIAETLGILSDLRWSNASESVNTYFFYLQKKRKTQEGVIASLVPVINCMGSLATAESSQNLSVFLGILNSETEKNKEYNELLTVSVIKALGKLGDNTAFDYLLNVEYLPYSEAVKEASRAAIKELKW